MRDSTILGTVCLLGMVAGGLLAGMLQRLVRRMGQIREERKTLASLRPRSTLELAQNHQGK